MVVTVASTIRPMAAKMEKINMLLLLSQEKKSFFVIGNFSKIFAVETPTIVAHVDPTRDVPIIIAGSALPADALNAIAVAGISVIPAVFIAKKVHIEFVAVPFSGFSLSSSSIALRPKGVAALPNPRKFAEIFIIIAPIAG